MHVQFQIQKSFPLFLPDFPLPHFFVLLTCIWQALSHRHPDETLLVTKECLGNIAGLGETHNFTQQLPLYNITTLYNSLRWIQPGC